ncbi:MAG: adenine phosphoribosyltransferase [Candidatus Aenigmarchaeota archaeon]|nr:adenine phosphoribosyltransferase [Candidatus Aenigmarchaeota archaeon]
MRNCDEMIYDQLKEKIRSIPNFPKKGVVFRDITTLLKDPNAFCDAIKAMADLYRKKKIDIVIGIEARGFIFASAVAAELNAGFVPIRKPKKLPAETESICYELEYGKDSLEIHKDAISPGQNVLIVDDLLATGGTAKAAAELVKKLGGNLVSLCFLIELSFLNGRNKLKGYDISSLIKYDSE